MLDLAALKISDFPQMYEWDKPHCESLEDYTIRLSAPHWLHFRIEDQGVFIGCLSLEKLEDAVCNIHLTMRQKTAQVRDVILLLDNVADWLFQQGTYLIVAEICTDNRAARWLAALCGMRPEGKGERYRQFSMTKERFYGRFNQEITI